MPPKIRVRVPQGLSLGPISIVIKTKECDHFTIGHGFNIYMYADDTLETSLTVFKLLSTMT